MSGRPEVGPVYYVGQECWARWGSFVPTEVGNLYAQRLVVIEHIDSEGIHVRTLDGQDGEQATATFWLTGELEVGEEKIVLVPVVSKS
jgi:hypothetical protein